MIGGTQYLVGQALRSLLDDSNGHTFLCDDDLAERAVSIACLCMDKLRERDRC